MEKDLDQIKLKGVKVNNLKNIDIDIPHEKLVVITGVSGSGKSSLAFDTLYAEGQRRYVESLSSYARQFLGRLNKPEVDFIDGIPPAIAIQQKVISRNPRSTVGTSTEIYDYFKLLFARIGHTYSPVSGQEVKRHNIKDVVDYITGLSVGTKTIICFKYIFDDKRTYTENLELLTKLGYNRVLENDEIIKIDELLDNTVKKNNKFLNIIVDRIKARDDDALKSRLSDSVQTAFFEGRGECCVLTFGENPKIETFNNRFEADGIEFEIPTEHMFSFNNPIGACPLCEGYGKVLGIDEDLVVPDKSLSIYQEAVVCWKGEKMQEWRKEFISKAAKYDFPVHRPYYMLTADEKEFLWYGKNSVSGIYDFFNYVESKKHKIQYRIMLSRYRGKTTCPECKGKRLKKEAFYVKIVGKSIGDLIDLPIYKLKDFFDNLKLNKYDNKVATRLLTEINIRLQSMLDVGLSYLTLNRLSVSLSGGESQRIRLATVFGAGLTGSLYILDEPSIGLHPRDTQNLIKVLQMLKEKGNTVVVVEHDEEIIRAADHVIDIGPGAGNLGGEIVFRGGLKDLQKSGKGLTADYINGKLQNPRNTHPQKWRNYIEVMGARHHNLNNIDVKFPLEVITVVTGVSGSGKTSLVKGILFPAIKKLLGQFGEKTGEHTLVNGDIHMIKDIEYVDQNPIGKSSRSNPATYIKAWDEVRKLYAEQKHSKANGYKASHFSFNVTGGRCEVCQGEGEIKVEMQFMADVFLVCEACNGKRFKDDILEVKFNDKSIFDILEMTVEEAVDFFNASSGRSEKKIAGLLQNYIDVGLGYVKLGQSSNTLSGGESQRIKLASYLSIEKAEPSIFVFDEPTVGLHFHDISKLLKSFSKIRDKGHSLIIIEHNPEVIRFADYVIDLGPGGGEFGGNLVFEGTPQELSKNKDSITGLFV
jgi:excinuclease ABC subunit A